MEKALIDLILGLLNPETGEIYIDKHNMRMLEAHGKKLISHVPQDVYYSDDSFSKNIAFGSDETLIDNGKLITASKDAQIYDYIMQQKDKFNHILGESGVQLSGGQNKDWV